MCTKAFNRPGMSCQAVEGAMYAFPSFILPPSFVAEAKGLGLVPDFYYCKQLLEQTGIVVVPGSGFLQREGTWHFRSSILAPLRLFESFLERLTTFHDSVMAKHHLGEEDSAAHSIPARRPNPTADPCVTHCSKREAAL
eukprot:gnl/Chilomastix_caulleri/1913.p1 GENE.gnl/Chilomastix_caulleri/1913~~gnl/Chilomastix_caulleri/1913.p1  ORF type:complete len:139 (+),score=38.48 gnl/Chilomastix_caulleri/1913:122-538(+)